MTSILKVDQLQDSGGNAIITSNGSGTITAGAVTNKPAFRATMSADQTVPTTTWTKMNFNTVEYDTHSGFDTSNYRYTIPTGYGGKYLFTSSSNFYLDDIRSITVALYVNGSRREFGRSQVESASSNSFTAVTATFIVTLSAGDYVESYTLHANGNDRGLNKNYPEFTGHRLIGV